MERDVRTGNRTGGIGGRTMTLPPIDYIIASRFGGSHMGLVGEEISAKSATVHTGLLPSNPEDFRRLQSDHLPVTVKVKVMADTDKTQ